MGKYGNVWQRKSSLGGYLNLLKTLPGVLSEIC